LFLQNQQQHFHFSVVRNLSFSSSHFFYSFCAIDEIFFLSRLVAQVWLHFLEVFWFWPNSLQYMANFAHRNSLGTSVYFSSAVHVSVTKKTQFKEMKLLLMSLFPDGLISACHQVVFTAVISRKNPTTTLIITKLHFYLLYLVFQVNILCHIFSKFSWPQRKRTAFSAYNWG
jgi:hypothetical protein